MDREKLARLKEKRGDFMAYNGLRLKSFQKNCAEIELKIGAHSLNPVGIVHGGVYYAMADCAAGAAARSNGGTYLTLRGALNYLKSVSEGTITSKSTVLYRGGATCVVRVDITDEAGTLLSEGDFTMFCVERPSAEGTAGNGGEGFSD